MDTGILNGKLDDVEGWKNYLTDVTQQHPAAALGASFGVGILLSAVGVSRLFQAGLWLKAQGLMLPSLNALQASSANPVRH